MNNIDEIVAKFEDRVTTILNENAKRMQQQTHDANQEKAELDKGSKEESTVMVGAIALSIDSEKDAKKVHKRIRKLIKAKKYPIKETGWSYSKELGFWLFDFEF